MVNNEFEEQIKKHLTQDYPNVVQRLDTIEKLLEQIAGGIKVIKFLGWVLTSISGMWLFFQEFIIHITSKSN